MKYILIRHGIDIGSYGIMVHVMCIAKHDVNEIFLTRGPILLTLMNIQQHESSREFSAYDPLSRF